MKTTLKLAAIYNLLWGAWVVLFPFHFFDLVGMQHPSQPMIWQGVGMIVGVYGIGYWLASYNPLKHWPIVFVGLLGKVFGPIGFIGNYLEGKVPFCFFYTLITNDFAWWIPFGYILYNVHKKTQWKLT